MKTKHSLLTVITSLMMTLPGFQNATAQTMQVHHANGATTDLVLGTETTVRFQDDRVLLSSPSQTRDFAKADVLRFTYTVLRSDVNGDSHVDVADIATIIDVMAGAGAGVEGDLQSPVPARSEADVNGDGAVDVADIASVISTMAELARMAQMPKQAEATTANGTIGEAFYIYRNDGQFNAFFREEIDSIGFSHYDADSLRYNKIASQVVYTPDSTYMIPLVAIDSVGFVQPEVKLNSSVIQMEKGLLDYLVSVNGMTLSFQKDLPNILKPSFGSVLVCTTFDHPLFEEGFVGKVQHTAIAENAFVVECDTVFDITDIFERLVTIEKVYEEDETAHSRLLYAPHTWISNSIPVSLNLNYDGANAKVSGSIEGSYLATVTWNITPGEEHFMDVRINHDWHYSAHLNFHGEKPFFKKGSVWVGPAIRFPHFLPVFKFQLMGSPFVRGEGKVELDLSLNGPTHSYLLTGSLRNGQFSGWSNRPIGHGSNSNPSFDSSASLSLNGFVQGGYMVEFYLGTIKCLGYAKAAIDCYLGPKLTCDFTMNTASNRDFSFYNTFKDSKLSLDILSLDIEAYGEAAYLNQKPIRHKFFAASFPSPIQHSWYLMPDFTEPIVVTDDGELSASITCTPNRDILIPLGLGLGVYDENDNLVDSKFETSDYKRENEGFKLNQTFKPLSYNKSYTARPMIRMFGNEIPASPPSEFKVEKFPVTLSDFKVTKKQYQKGTFYHDGRNYDYRFDVSVKATLDDDATGITEWGYAYLDPNGNEALIPLTSFGHTYTDTRYAYFRSGTPPFTCTLYGYAKYADSDEPVYGEPHDYPLEYGETSCPDENHPHAIDLGLPSGTKWACCNVGASTPEGYGNYYAWGETSPKSVYNWDTYAYWHDNDGNGYAESNEMVNIGSDIAGTGYDAATVNWGSPWRMPSLAQIQELLNNTTSTWTTQNGVNGRKFTGSNGGTVFLPVAGSRWYGELYGAGSYGNDWSSTLDEGDPYDAYGLNFGSGDAHWGNYYRSYGHTVRPVR